MQNSIYIKKNKIKNSSTSDFVLLFNIYVYRQKGLGEHFFLSCTYKNSVLILVNCEQPTFLASVREKEQFF